TLVPARTESTLYDTSYPRSFFLMLPRHPSSTLFPYTTLFRSCRSHSTRVNWPSGKIPSGSSYSSGELVRSTSFFVSNSTTQKKRSEEHTSELQSLRHLVCRLLLEKKNNVSRENGKYITVTA